MKFLDVKIADYFYLNTQFFLQNHFRADLNCEVPADGVEPNPDISKFDELIDRRISPEPRFESSLPLSNLRIN